MVLTVLMVLVLRVLLVLMVPNGAVSCLVRSTFSPPAPLAPHL